MTNTELLRAHNMVRGAKILKMELGDPKEGGGVILTLSNGAVLYAGVRDENDEEGAVNGYDALKIRLRSMQVGLG